MGRFLTVWMAIFLSISFSYASELIERKGLTPAGEIIFVAGNALVRLVPEESYRSAVPRQILVSNDIIKTTASARLSILFKDETQLKLASNTTLIIKEVIPNKEKPGALKILLRLESGEVWTRSKSAPEGLMIETPYATAAIRGTEWTLSVKDNESRVSVMEGSVQLSNPLGSITVGRNEQAVVTGQEAPLKSILITPGDRTQWTYYLSERRLLGYLKFTEGSLGKAEILFNEGKLEESARSFEQMRLTEPGSPAGLTGLGMIELKAGDSEKTEGYFDQSLKIKKTPLALLGKAYLFISKNQTVEATEILGVARDSFLKDPLPFIFSSYLHTFYGDFPGALRECDQGLSAIPNNPLLLAFKADLYFILNQPEEAKRTIDLLLLENPRSSEGYERLGFYDRMVIGDSQKAKEAFRKSILLDALNDEALAKLADLLRNEGDIPEALKLIEEALSIAPWNAMHHYNYGRLLADINKIDKARAEFKKSLDLDRTFSRAYLGEGIVLLKEGQPNEALRELSIAGLFEPNLAEIHNFLAIAYYQRFDPSAALNELKRAEECDPLDSTPHQLASAIYNNLYRPVEAIEEARKVIDLLPYRKASGEALLEAGQNGAMSVNYGLDFLNLPEWSLYYAQKAAFINPYRNTSHIGVALAYDQLGQVSSLQGFNEFSNPTASERLTGLTLNVNSLNFSNRYSTLISKPGHYVTLGGAYGFGDSNETSADLEASGDFGSRFPLTYSLSARGYRDSGHLENSEYKTGRANLILGFKPDYDQDIYLDLNYINDREGIPPAASNWLERPDNNQAAKDNLGWIQLGYHKRFSPTSHLIAAMRYVHFLGKIENPDFPGDFTGFSVRRSGTHNFAAGIRHLFTLYGNHQVSHGIDFNLLNVEDGDDWPYDYPLWILLLRNSIERRSLIYHLYDRWALLPWITLDGGLFFSYYNSEVEFRASSNLPGYIVNKINRDSFNLNPRAGIAVDLWKKGVLRLAYQRRSTPGFAGELAPVDTSGLIPPTFDIEFNRADDVEGSIEYELMKKTFFKALIGYERLSDLTTPGDDHKAQLVYGRIALNQILGRFFSFSIRYHYNDSLFLDGSGRHLPGIPRDSGDARLVFIHPIEMKVGVRESYTGPMFADDANRIKLKGYFSTDLYAQKEFFKKRVFLSAAINNLFNTSHQTLDHPSVWYGGIPLPAKGRTFYFRGEYRF
jgi:tetratricopeptide (TPR) repeat protein